MEDLAELEHADVLVFCYRTQQNLSGQGKAGIEELDEKVKSLYDDTFGSLGAIVESITWYRRGGGLRVALKMPMTSQGQLAVIRAINTALSHS
jgi:hypothetical protein